MSETTPAPGVQCPRCHCRHMPVVFTRHRGKWTVRTRQCRNCGRQVKTREQIVHEYPDR